MTDTHSSLTKGENTIPILFLRYNPHKFTIDEDEESVSEVDREKQLVHYLQTVTFEQPFGVVYMLYDDIGKMNSVLPLRLQQFLPYKKNPSIEEFLKVQLNPNELDWYNAFLKHRQNDGPEEFLIDFERLINNLGYSRKDSAKRLLKQLEENVDYNILHQDVDPSIKGSKSKETITLTINAAQRFCLMSNTSEGKVIAKTIVHLMECLADYHILSAFLKTKQFRHDTIVELYSNYPVVYLADIYLYENNTLKVYKKIGWSNNISSRQDSLQKDLKTNCMFTHVFPCIRSLALEQ